MSKIQRGLRSKIVTFSLVTSIAMGLVGLYNQLSTRDFIDKMINITGRNSLMFEVEERVNTINESMHNYVNSKGSNALKKFLTDLSFVKEKVKEVDFSDRIENSNILQIDIVYLTNEYLNLAEEVVAAKRGRDTKAMGEAFKQSQKVLGFIREAMTSLRVEDFTESKGRILFLSSHLSIMQWFNGLMLLTFVGIGIVFGFWFSVTITDPLVHLTKASALIAAGEYEKAIISVKSNDEFGILGETFEKMRASIIQNLRTINENALIEAGLMEERVKNLNMKHLLKQSELKALQSRINPHFLFNTLNAGIQLALIEDAEQTRIFMENLSDLLRKTLHSQDGPISIKDEIGGLSSYLYLIKLRFADRFNCIFEIPEIFPDISLPSLVLQPLVENSLMHGLADRESGGEIKICLAYDEYFCRLGVLDNGIGMSQKTIANVMSQNEAPEHSEGGIGLRNVINRMRLFFDSDDVVHIRSEIGKGTEIWFEIPRSKREQYD